VFVHSENVGVIEVVAPTVEPDSVAAPTLATRGVEPQSSAGKHGLFGEQEVLSPE
jgi:hypothetical protein